MGWALSMTSDSGQMVDDGKTSSSYWSYDDNLGFILATHDSESCISEDHPDLPIPITTISDAYIVELGASGNDGKFETPSGVSIKYDAEEWLINHWSIDKGLLINDSWCSTFTSVTETQPHSFTWDPACTMSWGDPMVCIPFDPV